MNNTASPLEIIAAIVNLAGILCAGLMMLYTIRRYRAAKATKDRIIRDRLELAAWRHIRSEIRGLAYHVGSIFIGGWAMMIPSGETWYGFAAMMLRVLLGLLFTVLSIMDLRTDDMLWKRLARRRVRAGRP